MSTKSGALVHHPGRDGTQFSTVEDEIESLRDSRVTGPASATDNAFALFDGTTGKLIKDSAFVDVPNSRLATMAEATLKGRARGAGTGDPTDLTSAQALSVLEILGKQTIFIPAAAMLLRTTNGATSGNVELATNKNMVRSLNFDTTTQEFAQFEVWFPKSWNLGTVTAQFMWSHAATVTNFGVVWALEAVGRSDDDAQDVAFGTAQQVADTGGTTDDLYITSETPAITIGGSPALADSVLFQVKRVPADGSDTLAIDARLQGIRLFYTTNAPNDA